MERLRREAFELAFEREKRLLRVAEAVRAGGVDLCGGKISPLLGVIAIARSERIYRWSYGLFDSVLSRRFDLDDRVRILWAMAGQPGALAGLEPGDVVLRIDGRKVTTSGALYSRYAASQKGPYSIRVERGGEVIELEVPNRMGCLSGARLVVGDPVFAGIDIRDRNLLLSTGMLRFVRNDDELALVVGHEIAHYLLSHQRSRPEWERDADYLGTYIVARSGFDVSKAVSFWTRVGRRLPATLESKYRHPPSPSRLLALEATLDEISRKRANGHALIPERL